MKLFICLFLLFPVYSGVAQHTLASGAGQAAGVQGSFTYSIGQQFTGTTITSAGSTQHGVQVSADFTLVGLSENDLRELNIYPNPTSGSIYFGSAEICSLTLYTTNGQIVEGFSWSSGDKSADLTSIATGVYVLVLEDNKGSLFQNILIKK